MFPSTVGAVAALLLLVVPGISFELSWRRRTPQRQETAFVETARILLAGTIISAAVLVLLGIARSARRVALIDGQQALTVKSYVGGHLESVAQTVVWFLILALTLGTAAARMLPSGAGLAGMVANESGWVVALGRFPAAIAEKEGTARPMSQVLAHMDDRAAVFGTVASWSAAHSADDRELILRGPLGYRAAGSIEWRAVPDFDYAVVRGSCVTRIDVHYVTGGTKSLRDRSQSIVRKLARLDTWLAYVLLFAIEVAVLFFHHS